MHHVAALRHVQHTLAVVNIDLNGARRSDLGLHPQQQNYQDEGYENRYDYCAYYYLCHIFPSYKLIPMKIMNARPMRPTVMKVMPIPLRGLGTLL